MNQEHRIFIWHQFEQFEAAIFDKILTEDTKKESFKQLTKVVDLANGFSISTPEEREWMNNRLEEIAGQFPNLVN